MASFERCFLQFSVLKWKFRSRYARNNHFKPHRAVLPVFRRAEYTGFFSRPAHANVYGQASYQLFHSLPLYFKAVSVWLLLLYLGRAKKTGLSLWCRGKSLHSKQYWAWAISGGARERGWTGGGGSFAAPSPTFLLKKLKSGVSPPQKKSVPTALHKPQNLESFLQNLYYTRKVFLTHQCPHLFAGRHCQDEDDMKKIVEEFHRDFTRTHNRLKKKARALIKLRQKQSKSGGYVINPMYDTQSASLW